MENVELYNIHIIKTLDDYNNVELCDIINKFPLYPIEIFNNIKNILYKIMYTYNITTPLYKYIFKNKYIIKILNEDNEINIITQDINNNKYINKLYSFLCKELFNYNIFENNDDITNDEYVLLIRLKNTVFSYITILSQFK